VSKVRQRSAGRPRNPLNRILGPTWIPSNGRWRVLLIRPGAQKQRRVRHFKSEAEAAAFIETTPVEDFVNPNRRNPHGHLKRAPEIVYFIRSGTDGPIKIGKASDVMRRLSGLQSAHAEELRLLATTRAVTEDELHQRFAHLRMRGEWFRAEPELLAFIDSMRGQKMPLRV
jgi:hypothetical protein